MAKKDKNTVSPLLDYNPDNFVEDYVYFKSRHTNKLREYINGRFPLSAEAIPCIPENVVKSFIKSQAKTFKFGFKIVGFDMKNKLLKKIYDYSLPVLINAEQFYDLNQYSAVWFFLSPDNKMIKTKALHCSQFYREIDETGKTKFVIVKTNSFIENGTTYFTFLKYENNLILKAKAESWSELTMESFQEIPSTIAGLPKIYKTLPFIFISDDDLIKPYNSQLILMEKELIAGDGYAILSFYISMLKKIYGTGSLPSGEFEKVTKFLGVMLNAAKLPKDADLKVLDMGGTDNQMNYSKFFDKILLKRAKADAVDSINITEVTKVESGAAKRQELVPVVNSRNEDILFFTPVLHEYFIVLSKMYLELLNITIPEIEEFIFNDMLGIIDVTEQADINQKEYDLLEKKYKAGVISYKMFVMAANKCNEKEADKIIKEVEKERKQEDIFNDTKTIPDNENNIDENENNNNDNLSEEKENIKPKAENKEIQANVKKQEVK